MNKRSLILGILLVAFGVVCLSNVVRARVVYVDSTVTSGLQNGTSWANAYASLQTALTAAIAGDSLWVANGTYYPGTSGNNAATFDGKVNVRLFGGFEGFGGAQETQLTQRNWFNNLTVLSGDLDRSASLTGADAYHVVSAIGIDSSSTFDGFRITGGNAIGTGVNDRAGGVFLVAGGVRIVNCDIRGNHAVSFGGGIFGNGHLVLQRSFVRNNTTPGQGAGLYLAGGGNVVRITNCVISGNVSSTFGGAFLLGVPNTRIYQCTIANNTANTGSVMFNSSSAVLLVNCIVWGNSNLASQFTNTVPTVHRSIVQGGLASGTGILDANPAFRDANFRIRACSPALDAGDSLVFIPVDLDGAARPFDGDNNAVGKWDLGAFEVQVTNTPPAANGILGPNPSCVRQQNVLYQPANNLAPTNTYTWSLGGGGSIDGSATNPTVNIDWGNSTGSFVLTMVETGAISGCSTLNSVSITLQAAPVVTLTPNGAGALCAGDSILVTGNGSGVSRQWYRNGAMIGGATGPSVQAKVAGRYNMLLTGSNGCADSAAVPFVLTVNPLPVFSLSHASPAMICVGQSFPISGPTLGNAYQWYRNGVLVNGANASTLNATLAGHYNLLYTNTNGCRDSATAGVNLVVNPLPVVTLTPPGRDTICPGASLLLSGTAANDTAWRWYRNGFLIMGANTDTYNASTSGTYNVIVTDANGCRDSAAVGKGLRVGDFETPDAICRNLTVYLDAGGTATLLPAQINNGSTDDCGIAGLALSTTSFGCAQVGINAVTLTVTDSGANTDQCTAQVTVLDSIRPVAICSSRTVYLGSNGQVNLGLAQVNGGSTDNCGIVSSNVVPSFFACVDTGSHVVSLTVQDASGNARSCTANITIADSTRPQALCAHPVVSLNGGGTASIVVGQVENGSTDNCGIASTTLSRNNFSCADVPGVTVTLSVRDVSGNTGTCNAYVRVQDLVSPVAVCRDTTIYIDHTGQSLLTPTNVDGGSSDNCAITLATLSQTLFTCLDSGLNQVTLLVQDADTNIASCIANVTVRDTVAPTAVCSDTTFYLGVNGTVVIDPLIFGVNSADNCNFFDTAYVNVGPFDCSDLGSHSVTLTLSDVSGATDQCTGLVTIADSTGPDVQCRNVDIYLGPTQTATLTAAMVDNGTLDNCQLDTLILDQTVFGCADVGLRQVKLTAYDAEGNFRECLAQIRVRDTVAPVAHCRNTTAYLDISGQATIAPDSVYDFSTDNCGGLSGLELSSDHFTCAHVGLTNTVLLTVYDGDSTQGYCSGTVTVLDTIRPEARCSARTLYLDGNGQATLTTAMVDAGSSDNCAISTRSLSVSTFMCQDTGSHAITMTLTDPSGNTDVCVANVAVVDSSAPVLACVGGALYLDANGALSLNASTLAGTSTDNCGIASVLLSQSSFACADTGTHAISLEFADVSGNRSTCTVQVTVLDTVAPQLTCLSPVLYLDANGSANLTLAMLDGGSSDACGVNGWAFGPSVWGCGDVGTTPVPLSVQDPSGNVGTCVAQVQVIDTIRPQANCVPLNVSLDANGQGIASGLLLSAGSTDACGIASALVSDSVFGCGDIGSHPVTVVTTDPSGNRDSCTTTVTVSDQSAPVAVCTPQVLQLGSNGTVSLQASVFGAGSTDNCSMASMTLTQSSFGCGDLGVQTVLLTVVDASGLRDTCSAAVEVVDTTGASSVPVTLGNDTIVCNGAALTLFAGAGHTTYQWSTGATTNSIAVNAAGTYAVSVTNALGCLGVDSITITAFVTPDPDLRTESSELVICQNDSLLLLVDPGFVAYAWSTGSTTNTTVITTGGNYIVQVTDLNGCTLVDDITIQYVPFPAPAPVISPSGNVSVCENEVLVLDAGAGYFGYLWNTGQTTQTITVGMANAYQVQVWNGFGCHSTSAFVNVQNQSAPIPDIFRNLDTLFTNAIGISYQWYRNGIALPGAIQRTYYTTLNGNYQVRVYYVNGCDNISEEFSFTVSNEEAVGVFAGLEVYPNPTNGLLYLKAAQPIRKDVTLRVVDLYGKVVLTQEWPHLVGVQDLQMGGLAAGLYMLEIQSGGSVARHSVVRQ